MFKFVLNELNYKSLLTLVKTIKKSGVDKLEIEVTKNQDNLPHFFKIIPFIYEILDYEKFFEIWLKDFPYCVINEFSRDHILPVNTNNSIEKIDTCSKCKFYTICSGFPQGYFDKYGANEICLIADSPTEIMVEVESRCNFNCQFCFNKNSFAKKFREKNELNGRYIKKIIDNVRKLNIGIIRFTGGEPLLRKDIFDLLKYAKDKNLEVRLNTNGSLVDLKVAKKLAGIVDNILIPIDSWDKEMESEITGFKNALERKIKAIKLLKKYKIPVVRVGTVALKKNIINFDKLSKFILSLPFDEWEFYRPIGQGKNFKDLSKNSINILTNKIFNLKQKTGRNIIIANAIPFCAVEESYKLNVISAGALFDDGHNRLVVDPRGFMKPHYFIEKNIGNPLNILEAWNHSFIKKVRSLAYLPIKCKKCRFKYKCRGGSRYFAKVENDNWFANDPLIPN